jgi:hypothetical protein
MNFPAASLSLRLAQPVLICGFFAVMMSRLFVDYILPRWELGDAIPLSTATVLDSFEGTDDWLRVRINGVPIGEMRTIVERDPESDGFFSWLMLDIRSPLLRTRLDAASRLNARLEMEQVHVRVHRSGEEDADLDVAAAVQQRRLLTRIKAPSGVMYREVSMQRPLTMNFAADAVLTSSAIQAGETYAMDLFDPIWGLSAGRMRVRLADTENIEVGGRYYRTRVVEATMPTGQMRVWINRDDVILRRAITFGRPDDDRGGASGLMSRIEVRLDLMTPEEIQRASQRLGTIPPPPNIDPQTLRGTDEGDLLEGIGLLPLILRSQTSQPRQDQ